MHVTCRFHVTCRDLGRFYACYINVIIPFLFSGSCIYTQHSSNRILLYIILKLLHAETKQRTIEQRDPKT